MKILLIALFLNTTLTNATYDTNHSNPVATEKIEVSKIFYQDEEGQLFFVDFQSIPNTVLEVSILQETHEILMEDVSELDQNMIYEIDLTLLNKGNYNIKLKLNNHPDIQTQIIIP